MRSVVQNERTGKRTAERAAIAAVPRQRRGLSLIEVLISMFVLAIGLLGVASLLPVGQLQIAKGEIEEQKRNVADVAFATIQAAGWRNPARWYDSGGAPFDAVNPASESRILFEAATGSTASSIVGNGSLSGSYHDFKDCVVEFRSGVLRGARRRVTSPTTSTTFATSAFPDVPFTFSGTAGDPPGDTFVVIRNEPFAIDPLYMTAQSTYRDFAGGGTAQANTPMPRINIAHGPATVSGTTVTPHLVTSETLAEQLCFSHDDLTFVTQDDPDTTGKDESDEVRQLFYKYNDGTSAIAAKRKSDGEYSWLATFVPQVPDPSANLSVDPQVRISDVDYTVSVAVFKNRLVRGTVGAADDSHEVALTFSGGGYGGGYAVLSGSIESLAKAKLGEWILVWNTSNPTRAYHWYEIAYIAPAGGTERAVRLVGPDWNTGQLGAAAGAKIFIGCVGVYQRHMQMERLPEN